MSINHPIAKYSVNKGLLIALAICCMLLGLLGAGCHKTVPAPVRSPDECMDKIVARLKELPEKSHLKTLDGQSVNLKEFFDACARKWPHCAMYAKFYYWASEVKEIESKSTVGRVRHTARMYYNPLSTCHPDHVNPGRTHGDVVEIYDEGGVFMGLGVYMGDGMYVTLPYSGYRGNYLLWLN